MKNRSRSYPIPCIAPTVPGGRFRPALTSITIAMSSPIMIKLESHSNLQATWRVTRFIEKWKTTDVLVSLQQSTLKPSLISSLHLNLPVALNQTHKQEFNIGASTGLRNMKVYPKTSHRRRLLNYVMIDCLDTKLLWASSRKKIKTWKSKINTWLINCGKWKSENRK